MEVTLLLPWDLGNKFSLYQARRYARLLPHSLISLIYPLVTKTLKTTSYTQNEIISLFFLEPESCNHTFSLLDIVVSTLISSQICFIDLLPLPKNYIFISVLHKVAWVWIPRSCSGMEVLKIGTLPHLLINSWGGLFQLPIWLVIHLWVRGLLHNYIQ